MKRIMLPSRAHEIFYAVLVALVLSRTAGRVLPVAIQSVVARALWLLLLAAGLLVVLYPLRRRSKANARHALVAALVGAGAFVLSSWIIPSRQDRLRGQLPALEPIVREILAYHDSLGDPCEYGQRISEQVREAGFVRCWVTESQVGFRGGGFLDDSWGVLTGRPGRAAPDPARPGGTAEGAPVFSLEPLGSGWFYYRTR